MTFRRTKSGLINQHLFHDVELVVFTEGGISYNLKEVYSGKYSSESNDIIYWQNVFSRFKDLKKIKFKSIGSKSTIKEIAVEIMNDNITTVMVAMDSEFDELLQRKLEHKNILYTNGYSWENDIWNDQVIVQVIEELSAIKIDQDLIQQNFQQFLKRIKIAVYSDGYLFSKNSSFFKRSGGYLGAVECNPTDLPFIKKDYINTQLSKLNLKKPTLNSYGKRKGINAHVNCYGHFLGDYCVHVVIGFLRNRLGLPTINKEIIYRMALNKFFQNHFDSSQLFVYYNAAFSRSAP